MLEEIVVCFLSLFSALTLDAPQLSRERSDSNTIDSECTLFEADNLSSNTGFVQVSRYRLRGKTNFIQTLLKSLKANCILMIAVLPLALMAMALIYLDLRTSELCIEWLNKNYTLSFDVKRIRLIGKGVKNGIVYVSFPMILILTFGWCEFKRHYSSTVLVGQLAGLLNTLYLAFLLLFGISNDSYYRRVVVLFFLVSVIWESTIVVRTIRQNNPTIIYSSCHIFMVVAFPYVSGIAMAFFYNYAVVSWFISLNNAMYRFILAMMTPTLAIVPTAICRHIALWRASEIIEPERSFALVYCIRSTFITLFRVIQADFGNVWLFVGLSVLSGVSNLLKTATVSIRVKVWSRIIKFLNKTCCSSLRHLPGDTPHHRRLKADTEIQNILFENISLILSQSYFVLYTIISFKVSDWTVVKSSLIRIIIGMGIEFVFNILSTFVRIHWHDIPIARVTSKHWKRHIYANGIVIAVLICYFSKPILVISQDRFHHTSFEANYTIRNCTLPHENWR